MTFAPEKTKLGQLKGLFLVDRLIFDRCRSNDIGSADSKTRQELARRPNAECGDTLCHRNLLCPFSSLPRRSDGEKSVWQVS